MDPTPSLEFFLDDISPFIVPLQAAKKGGSK